ncbi:MAG: DUF2970 domain-containing protein [Methylovulum sp.]|nr:DUF2970 domain-containing protein [Methylovulum sp.]TSA37906.1 MAG: DUF2970 domain-containing protein [Methylococcaceae bacterium]
MSKQSFFQIFKSVIAAFIGVQSNKNREQDFKEGSLKYFIIAGILFTALFVMSIILLVSTILG